MYENETIIEIIVLINLLTPRMPGISRNRPNMGTRRKKFIATGKKPLKHKTILFYDWFLFI